ncbi:hypothetical protein [Rhodococcus triatomae]
MLHIDPDAPHRWIIRCGQCDHYLQAAGDRITAEAFARTNGWVTSPSTRCPGCATIAAHCRPAEDPVQSLGIDQHRLTAA